MPGYEKKMFHKKGMNAVHFRLLEQHYGFKLDVFKQKTMTHSKTDSYDSYEFNCDAPPI